MEEYKKEEYQVKQGEAMEDEQKSRNTSLKLTIKQFFLSAVVFLRSFYHKGKSIIKKLLLSAPEFLRLYYHNGKPIIKKLLLSAWEFLCLCYHNGKPLIKKLLLSAPEFLRLFHNETGTSAEEKERAKYIRFKVIADALPKLKKMLVVLVFVVSAFNILRKSTIMVGISLLASLGFVVGLYEVNANAIKFPAVIIVIVTLIVTILIVLVVTALISSFFAFLCGVLCESISITVNSRVFVYESMHAQDSAKEAPFASSIKTNYKYLDQYYAQIREQAQQGFNITMFIVVFGALLIFIGVIAMYFGFVQPAIITCASGAITELISAIFFYLYNKTITSMSRYHNKLVLSKNIDTAVSLSKTLPEDKQSAAKLSIISELIKDVNAQMMKSDADDAEKPKKKQSDAEKPSDAGTQA